ncbi:hypothetical protein SUGI_0508170 [Cryptomeria japonica]|uniref:uncharacterized protein LOC131076485 n=1 Tax=Cryptomeria japonica TaxID=3369 RepID=UPI002408B7DD|nr:uncharacterized protein LOC131076485 [Cryptomeria japonica]GLJ26374.1 hypothetical protein SUGI_0508170 [Cryptomeria japonica]
MEDSLASQLPEANALPDGFSETFSETSNCTASAREPDKIKTLEQEDNIVLDGINSVTEITTQESEMVSALYTDLCTQQAASMTQATEFCIGAGSRNPISGNRVEKTEKERSFPVPLSDKDANDFPDDLVISSKTDCLIDKKLKHESEILESSGHATDNGHLSSDKYQSPLDVPSLLLTTEGSSMEPPQNTGYTELGGLKSNQSTVNELEKGEGKVSQGTYRHNSNDNSRSLKPESNSEMKVKQTKGTSKPGKELTDLHQKYLQVLAERDSVLLELKKNISLREKLEALCRELQRQNKMLTEECRKVSTEGQQKRLELSNKFHDAIKDVSTKLEEQKDERISQLKENEKLRDRLKQFSEQYEICKQQFEQQLKKKTLELQLAEIKLQQQQEACNQEQAKSQLYTEQITQLLTTEKNLRFQLAVDGEKFQEFQDTLTKSNEVFESFKKEMEKMAKTIKDLNKENNFLKSKCENSDISLIELVDERAKLKKQLEKTKNQKEKLESLCRSLQAERKQQGVVKGANDTTTGASFIRDQSTGEDPGKSI